MRALTPRQKVFVDAVLSMGRLNQMEAARKAGYTGNDETMRVTGHRLAHDPKIRAAILEEAQARMEVGGALAVEVLVDIAGDPTHKDRLKAAQAILDRVGLHTRTEHKVTVEHVDDAGKIEAIKLLASRLGIDAAKLLGHATVDAEFEEVTDWAGV